MKIIKILILFLFFTLFLSGAHNTFAHSGRTDSSGGHNCYVGACAGTYHYHNGGYSPPQPRVDYTFPRMNAEWEYTPNSYGSYTLNVKLLDSNPSQYSAVISSYAGADPGPKTDFHTTSFTFYSIKPGRQYLNVKKEINGYWSTVAYWTVEVPAWVAPTPTPKSIDTPTPTPSIDTSTNNKSFIGSFFDWLFGLFKDKNDNVDSSNLNSEETSYVCDCSKTCSQISSCGEAYYQLNKCGCSVRDGDRDGIPCENLCK